jgi:hypothetical protein
LVEKRGKEKNEKPGEIIATFILPKFIRENKKANVNVTF